METIPITFLSSDEKTTIHAYKWKSTTTAPTKILQITHGMQEFINRYVPFITYLVQNSGDSFLVVGHDHLGHGDSVLSQEDWGYFGEPNPSDLLIQDIHKLRIITQEEYPNLPYFIMGHSMGSYMLRKYLSFHSEGLSGAIIMGTGYVSPCSCSMGINVTNLIACFRGWHYRSSMVESLAMGGGAYKKYDCTGKDMANSWLTKDVNIVEAYYNEPKCSFSFTLNGFKGLFEAVNFSCKDENVQKIKKNLPIFIVSGKNDPVGDEGKGVQIVYDMMDVAGIKDLEMKLYENDRHEILNETDKEIIYEDIRSWINKKANKAISTNNNNEEEAIKIGTINEEGHNSQNKIVTDNK